MKKGDAEKWTQEIILDREEDGTQKENREAPKDEKVHQTWVCPLQDSPLEKDLGEEGSKPWQEGMVFCFLLPFSPKLQLLMNTIEKEK